MHESVRSGPAAQAAEPQQQQYLTFLLGGELFAIGILHIKEIIGYGQVTAVPMLPAYIRGVINLRGRVVPVVDLSARFGRQITAVGRRTCIVIVEVAAEGERQEIGVMVDAVNEVIEIPASEIEPAPDFGVAIRTDFIAGMGKVNGRFVIILQIAHVLSLEELAMLQPVSQGDREIRVDGGGARPAIDRLAPG